MIPVLLVIYLLPYKFVLFYFVFNYLLAVFLYCESTKFYFPHMKFKKDEIENFEKTKTNEKFMNQYFHEKYPSFQRRELTSISLGWIYYGTLNYVWFKAILAPLILFCIWLVLKIKFNGRSDISSSEHREYIFKSNRILGKLLHLSLGIVFLEKDSRNEEKTKNVYKKYLGEDYDFNRYENNYSTVVSNHVSYIDIVYFLYRESPSYTSKESVKKLPLVGMIAEGLNTFYIDRTSKENRLENIRKIEKRQQDTMEKKCLFPLCLFPEGTTTNGRTIISFKKGAFYALTPVKVFYFEVDNTMNSFSVATAGMNMFLNILLETSFFKINLTAHELPVFAPNDFLFENYKHLGKDKAEIYSEACRHIMSEISGFPLSNSTWDTKLQYITEIRRKKVKNT